VIEPRRALRDVRAALRAEVMPELSSARARSVLASALGIIDSVIETVRLDPEPAAASVRDFLAAAPSWEADLRERAPAAAEQVARGAAEAAAEEDPQRARAAALEAAAVATAAAWEELEGRAREDLLRRTRRFCREDVERQASERPRPVEQDGTG